MIFICSAHKFSLWASSLINENIFYLMKLCAGRKSLAGTEFLHIRGRIWSSFMQQALPFVVISFWSGCSLTINTFLEWKCFIPSL